MPTRAPPLLRKTPYRSARGVPPPRMSKRQRFSKFILSKKSNTMFIVIGVILVLVTFMPFYVFELPEHHSPNSVLRESLKAGTISSSKKDDYGGEADSGFDVNALDSKGIRHTVHLDSGSIHHHSINNNSEKDSLNHNHSRDRSIEADDHADGLTRQKDANQHVARKGKSTPIDGATQGTLSLCEDTLDVSDLVYWNSPQGKRDLEFVSPFSDVDDETKYVSFEYDRGGWNNIRMSMEIVFVFAAATGRTVVLPPEMPLYLLSKDKNNKYRGFSDFFPLDSPEFLKRLNIITTKEFLELEGESRFPMDPNKKENIMASAERCENRAKSDISCDHVFDHYRSNGYEMPVKGDDTCLIFDEDVFDDLDFKLDENTSHHVQKFCGKTRTPLYYTRDMQSNNWIHFSANTKEHRIFNHFYSFMLFTNSIVDNHFKRFVRDYLHYNDIIFCTAGKVIHELQERGSLLGFGHGNQQGGGGGYSAMHIRRGDFQFKKQKIDAEEWYENTKELWEENEILYIATDEKDRSFFDPIKEHHPIYFLSDFVDVAGLNDIDPNYMGMIETVIASRARVFAGTWFSTFTAYIIRMRGYHGMDMTTSWYGQKDRKNAMQTWVYPQQSYVSREWPLAWDGIDGDSFVMKDGQADPGYVHADDDDQTEEIAEEEQEQISLGRGVSGLPIEKTPALIGAGRPHIECDVNVDSLGYWNDPQGKRDIQFESPFADYHKSEDEPIKYITFEPDRGGWNNIRMSMEIIFIFAAVTGRTLVMPPSQPLYLLKADKADKFRGFANFFPLDKPEFRNHVKIISNEEFLLREGSENGRYPIPKENFEKVMGTAKHCSNRAKNKDACESLFHYFREGGHVPEISGSKNCLVFDEDSFHGDEMTPQNRARAKDFCGKAREMFLYNRELHDEPWIHFQASEKHHRLLNHFYGFVHFTNPETGNHYSRFVRDFLHYQDPIFCAAGKIVLALQEEAKEKGFDKLDSEHGGGYSSFHVRRGDLQYKKVKISGEEWYENTKELFLPNELIYIATDERNKTFFDPIKKHHDVKFLDDYWDYAKLGDLDPNFMGMIDTIVASRGRQFVGTFFSTFSGYINRMRGYHGMSMQNSWYGTLDKKEATHTWGKISGSVFGKEWPAGWVGIDGDEFVSYNQSTF